MKRITALLHPNRIGEVVHALAAAGHRRFSVVHGQGLLQALSAREQTYSVELGELITQQIQLDVYCVDDELPVVVDLIQRNGKTGQATLGLAVRLEYRPRVRDRRHLTWATDTITG